MAVIVVSDTSPLSGLEYARQAALDVRSGKLKPQSVAEIMSQLDETEAEVSE